MKTKSLLKALEYTPLGFIPGVLRLAHVAGRSVCTFFSRKDLVKRVDFIAAKYLTQDQPGKKLGRETLRGVIDCIPIVNTLCLGIYDLFHLKKKVNPNILQPHVLLNDHEEVKLSEVSIPYDTLFLEEEKGRYYITHKRWELPHSVEQEGRLLYFFDECIPQFVRREFQYDPDEKKLTCRLLSGEKVTIHADTLEEGIDSLVEAVQTDIGREYPFQTRDEIWNKEEGILSGEVRFEVRTYSLDWQDQIEERIFASSCPVRVVPFEP